MSGLPASGKSTFCEEKSRENGDIVIHRDYVRAQLREMLKSNEAFPTENWIEYDFFINWVVAAINATKKDVWIDQTTLNAGALNKLLHALSDRDIKLQNFNIIIEKIDTPLDLCIDRDAKRTGFERVTGEVICSMARAFHMSIREIQSAHLPEGVCHTISLRHHNGGNKNE